MRRRQLLFVLSTALISCLLIVELQLTTSNAVYAQKGSLLVSAAASLREVLEAMRPVFQQTHPGVQVTFNFGASGALLQQIEQGAPADVLISAARQQMDILAQKGQLLPETRGNLAGNRLALVVPQNSRVVDRFQRLTNSQVKRIAIGEPRSVPAGQYAEQVLKRLNLFDQVRSKLVFGNNVRQVLAAVESGNADAGIVYVTDAKSSDRVRTVAIADSLLHAPIVYPMAALRESRNQAAARAFLKFLSGNEARKVLRKYGFILPR